MSNHEIPRRNRIDMLKPAELAIWNAMQAVEAMPADVRLTEAGQFLQQAAAKVADFIDGIIQPPRIDGAAPAPTPLKPCPWCKKAPQVTVNLMTTRLCRCPDHTRWMTRDGWNEMAPLESLRSTTAPALREAVGAFLKATDECLALPDNTDANASLAKMNIAREEMRKAYLDFKGPAPQEESRGEPAQQIPSKMETLHSIAVQHHARGKSIDPVQILRIIEAWPTNKNPAAPEEASSPAPRLEGEGLARTRFHDITGEAPQSKPLDDSESLDPRYGKPHARHIMRCPYISIEGHPYLVAPPVWEVIGQQHHSLMERGRIIRSLRASLRALCEGLQIENLEAALQSTPENLKWLGQQIRERAEAGVRAPGEAGR